MAQVGPLLVINDQEYFNGCAQTTTTNNFPNSVSKTCECKPSIPKYSQTKKNCAVQTTKFCQSVGQKKLVRPYIMTDDFFRNQFALKIQSWWRKQLSIKKFFVVLQLWNSFLSEQEAKKNQDRYHELKSWQEERMRSLYPHTKAQLAYWNKELQIWKSKKISEIQESDTEKEKIRKRLEILEGETNIYKELFHRMHCYHKLRKVEKRKEFLVINSKPLAYSVPTDTQRTVQARQFLEEYSSILVKDEKAISKLKEHTNLQIKLLAKREAEFKERNLSTRGILQRLNYAYFKYAEAGIQ
eukprot:NODE_359_length_8799_cov_0.795172.p4 type:complete len:298 gc:universal NODE_359_length_8799_cov_0.795172:1797-2690(+)